MHSTLREAGNKTVVGDLIPGRHLALLRDKWVPLAAILTADHDSPYYNEKNKAGALYNEGWALTHMLILSPEYRPQSSAFLVAAANGKDSVQALEDTYGKPLAAIEKDLQAYLRGTRFLAALVPSKLDKITQNLSAEPAPPFDVKLALLDLSNQRGKQSGLQADLEALAAEAPTRPEPHVELGYLLWRQNDNDGARKEFEKAFALGGRGSRMLWDYGRMVEFSNPKDVSQAFEELLNRQPNRVEVRIELAAAQLNAGQTAEAIRSLNKLTSVTHDQAPRYFTIGMFAAMRLGDRGQAKTMADRILSEAKSSREERQRAEEMIQSLNQPAPAVARELRIAPPAATAEAEPEKPPTLTRRPGPQQPQPAVLKPGPTVSGTLVDFVCDRISRIVVETPEGRKSFTFQDAKGFLVKVNGLIRTDYELYCGRQEKPATVSVQYNPPASAADGDGRLVVLSFE